MQPPAPITRARFNSLVLRWYSRNGRKLPWRGTRSKYRVLVSEIMLQQTQVSRVLGKYPGFISDFPDFSALAKASRRKVIVAWEGMGYNNRAIRLQEIARIIVRNYRGRLPKDEKHLRLLPGVGKYTARALMAFTGGRSVPAVDVNAQRLLSRVFWRMDFTTELKDLGAVWELAEGLVHRGRAYDWNQAIMDVGATICMARAPRCPECPVARLCASRLSMKHAIVQRSASEPSFHGIPNRIYRGRIVDVLRRSRGAVSLPELGRAVHRGFTVRNRRWLESLVEALRRDGLLKVLGNGSYSTRTVSLP